MFLLKRKEDEEEEEFYAFRYDNKLYNFHENVLLNIWLIDWLDNRIR